MNALMITVAVVALIRGRYVQKYGQKISSYRVNKRLAAMDTEEPFYNMQLVCYKKSAKIVTSIL